VKRREFITLLGGAVAWPLAAGAQQPATPVVGLLSARSPVVDVPLISVIRRALNDGGFIEGRNVAFDYRWADGQYDRMTGLAASLVRQQVAVIVTMDGDPSALAAKAATATIPIVVIVGNDPVHSGLVTSLHRPGGNLTGTSTFLADVEPKRLGLLQELRPNAKTTAALVNPGVASSDLQMKDIRSAAGGNRAGDHHPEC